ncbi:glycosyl hydrolase [Jiulongibacter sediminis]|uniref:glycosyl hydrolase n=1 Tax=Jiulongibacter sediminis TaxID=1605367 RepID=UPI0026F01622|nr:glycosyl hydrolase [Jiulongibacter sediminis]
MRILKIVSLLLFSFTTLHAQLSDDKWFPKYDFSSDDFKNPSNSFGPMARWWWPGNDVDSVELKREINLFAEYNFAGMEIQPFFIGVPYEKEANERIRSWDTPSYYANLKAVLSEARKRGMFIDMTNGSGWPAGGSMIQPDDGFRNLKSNVITIEGGIDDFIAIPKVNARASTSRLQAIVAAKTLPNQINDKTTLLDIHSLVDLTGEAEGDSVKIQLPGGTWKIIAFWSLPSGESSMAAQNSRGYVVDHFNSIKVSKLYEHLFGERTGLSPFYGRPLRAIFNDSYEFKADRHYSDDFIEVFKANRGYDPVPYFPANMQKGLNYVEFMNPHAPKDYSFGDQLDQRIRYDYDLTLSDLLGKHFMKTSKDFAESRGMLHRTQTYGLAMDMMYIAGQASIPEMESMLASEANMKIISSGAHLYNRPLISSESVVFIDRAAMTTPQKTKIAVDKLFAAGANQIIFHGIPYNYYSPLLPKEGWNPFSSPALGMVNFSSHYGENDIFWKYQKDVNEYISRAQYALRSGKPKADVLIYFPFMKVEGMPINPLEIMAMGEMPGIEPPLKKIEHEETEKAVWAEKAWELINELDSRGITWEWVNDHSILEAELNEQKEINVRGNIYQSLILSDTKSISPATAKKINSLTNQGLNILVFGNTPERQPSFLNWEENDKLVQKNFLEILKSESCHQLKSIEELSEWLATIEVPIKYNKNYPFLRQLNREMKDGDLLSFFWNTSDDWQTIELSINDRFQSSSWYDATDGSYIQNNSTLSVSYDLPPYGTVFLSTIKQKEEDKLLMKRRYLNPNNATEYLRLNNWEISSGEVVETRESLFDFKSDSIFKYIGDEITYKTSFKLKKKNRSSGYFLDLGKVYHTAEIYLNGQHLSNIGFEPYTISVDEYLVNGINQLEIKTLPTKLNYFIGEAEKGNPLYKQFKNQVGKLMSNGLVGPVRLMKQ